MRLCFPAFLLIAAAIATPALCRAYTIGDWDLAFKTGVTETYDDNITFTDTGTKDDFITSAVLGLSAKFEGKTKTLQLSGNITHEFFAKNNDFDNTSEDLTGQFSAEISPYDRIIIKDSLAHAEEPRSFEDAFGRTSGRYSTLSNKFTVNYIKDITKELSLYTRAGYDTQNYSRQDLQDSTLYRAGADLQYAVSANTIAIGSYDYYLRKFTHGNDAQVHTLAPGFRQYFTEQIYLDARAGANFIRSYNDRHYTKPYFFLALTNELDETTTTGISYTKEYSTNASTQDIFNYWQVAANYFKQLSERVQGYLTAFFGEGKYPNFAVTDKLKGARVGVTYDFTQDFSGSLNYAYSKTTSNISSREYAKNTCSVSFIFKF